jgi:hypothetical protein
VRSGTVAKNAKAQYSHKSAQRTATHAPSAATGSGPENMVSILLDLGDADNATYDSETIGFLRKFLRQEVGEGSYQYDDGKHCIIRVLSVEEIKALAWKSKE